MILSKLAELAVLGTSKKNVAQEILDWGKQFKLDDIDKEQYLLQAAYIDKQMQEAGKLIEEKESCKLIEKINDAKYAIDDNFLYHLKQLLEEYSYLILPYLNRVIAAEKTLPAQIIPGFLDYSIRQNSELKEKICQAAGNRVEFLAKFNNDWKHLVKKNIDWDTANHKDRLEYAKVLRKEQPEKVIDLLQQCFDQEHSKEKLELLECLAINLGEYDLTFLGSCLEDRSIQIVQMAFDFLLRIDSTLQESIINEAGPYFKLHKGGFLTSNRLEINLPENNDGFLKKLGSSNFEGVKLGKKATILHRIVSRLPLEFYSIPYPDLIKLANKSEWKAMLLSAWQNAAIFYNDGQWALELIIELIKNNIPIDSELTKMLTISEFNSILKMLFANYKKKIKRKEEIGEFLKKSNQEIDMENAITGINQIAELKADIEKRRDYLYHEDKKIINNFFSRIPWEIKELPEILEDYKGITDIKQNLLKSIE